MSAPAIPAGYRRLKVGEKRPKGYKFFTKYTVMLCEGWLDRVGDVITKQDAIECGPYIAPVRRRKGGKKGRAK